ncbi:MAG: M28 family peptidase [Bacteroidota bacterium]|nr:M28 family peptidase [Bacteroidota bacterium]
MNYRLFLVAILLLAASCGKDRDKEKAAESDTPVKNIQVPPFNGDSAYHYVAAQVAFGPRIPNTAAHRQAADYFVETFKQFGAQITIQEFQAQNYAGQKLNLKNIVAAFNPEKPRRILLAAHWDTRPFSDKDPEKPRATFPGANDGASGVGVLLEIARVISSNKMPEVGVDIILFDGEDWGEPEGQQQTRALPEGLQEWWCLGSQHWARNKHKPNYSAYYGILLDMVGARGARFHREGYSMEFAPSIVEKVWGHARRLGYAHIFVPKTEGGITDDHLFVNTIARIPMINIVHFEPGIGYFGDFHHSQKDNLELISAEMLGIVGTTVLNTIYYED